MPGERDRTAAGGGTKAHCTRPTCGELAHRQRGKHRYRLGVPAALGLRGSVFGGADAVPDRGCLTRSTRDFVVATSRPRSSSIPRGLSRTSSQPAQRREELDVGYSFDHVLADAGPPHLLHGAAVVVRGECEDAGDRGASSDLLGNEVPTPGEADIQDHKMSWAATRTSLICSGVEGSSGEVGIDTGGEGL